MLRIKNVSARNFMSIGNNTQAVNFDNCNLTLVLGQNGTGKTTIINALSYALYGEALTNIRKDNLINKTNAKGMMATVEFESHGIEYRIERGRRPNTLKFLVNGTDTASEEQQGDSRETQKAIEKIIGFPHNMFKHLVALNTYSEPFLSMKTNDQRDMIEQLLGITDLSLKAEELKEKTKNTKDSTKEEELRINAVQASNERIEKNIIEIESRKKAWDASHTAKVLGLESAITTLAELDVETEIASFKQNVEAKEQQDLVNTITKELKSLTTSYNRSKDRLVELQANLVKAQEGVCPTCEQGTAHLSTHEHYTTEIEGKIKEELEYGSVSEDKLAKLSAALVEINVPATLPTFYKTAEEAYEHKHNLESLASQYETKSDEPNPYVDQIELLRDTGLQEVSFDLINELTHLKDHQEFLYKLLTSKDSFIRKKIIDQNIAYLNHRLAWYLEKLGLPHDVKFANDLNVEITEYGRDLDFDNLSRGERNRLILGLSWAFRDIYESLNQPMNLMCIDELIDSGMDSAGVEGALAILKKMNREQNKNIMLISHKEELVGRVNNVLTVIKSGGFTEYNTDTEYVD